MLFDRECLLAAFRALDGELGRLGTRADVYVVGGAAIAIAYDARRATADVDAVFVPSAEVRRAAGLVAERLDLPEDWLNDAAKAFIPGDDPGRTRVFEGDNLQVAAASAMHLLAMKLLASRAERDQDDIRFLYSLCGFTTAREGLDLVASAYPSRVIPARTQFMLEEMFPEPTRLHRERGDDLGYGFDS